MDRVTRRVSLLIFLLATLSIRAGAATVSGVVMSSEGKALAGATVEAYALESSAARRDRYRAEDPRRVAVAQAVTDEKGKFVLDVKAAPVVDLAAMASGFAPAGVRAAGGEDVGAIALMETPDAKGRLTADGNPIPNAVVILSGPGVELVTRTDEAGRYSAADPSKWALRAQVFHPGFAPMTRLRTRDRLSTDFTLSPGVTLTGRALSVDGKTPLAGAQIFVDGYPYGTTGEDGAFSIIRVPDDWRELVVTKGELAGGRTRGGSPDANVTLRPAAMIGGTVSDGSSRTPVAFAEVTAAGNRLSAGESVITDQKGRFSFPPRLPGTLILSATAPDYERAEANASARQGEAVQKSLTLARTARIEGFILDEDKQGVAAARVTAGGAADPVPGRMIMRPTAPVVSGPDGRFVIRNVSAGTVDVLAVKKGFPSGKAPQLSVAAGEHKKNVVLTIPSGVPVTVNVADQNGRPVGRASVELSEWSEGSFGGQMRIMMGGLPGGDDAPQTNAEGTVEIRVKPGKYDIAVKREGFAPKRVRGVSINEAAQPVSVVLQPGAEIRGSVVTSNGTPVADAMINAFVPGPGAGAPASTTTGPDGGFQLSDLEPGQLMLIVSKQDEFIDHREMVEAPNSSLTIELPAGGRITGRVVDKVSKRPVTDFQAGVSGERSGAGMRIMRPTQMRSFRADDGSFTLENVPVGRQQVVVNAPGYVQGSVSGVMVEDGKTTSDIEVTLDSGVRVTGRVTGPDGSALEGVAVSVEREGQGGGFARMMGVGGATTDGSGEFVLEAVEAGDTTIRFEKDGFVPERKASKLSGKEARVDARLSRGTEVTGSVVTEAGVPVADARVEIRSSVQGSGWNTKRTDSNGVFRAEGLTPGRYTFTAFKDGFPQKTVNDIDVVTTPNVRIVLESGGVIYGRVIGYNPQDVRSIVVQASSSTAMATSPIDDAGNFRIEGAPTGSVSVGAAVRSMTRNAMTKPTRVEVEPGGSVQVDLTFEEGATVTGRVTRGSKVVSGARVDFQPKTRTSMRQAATTGSDGYYTVSGLDSGYYDVIVLDTAGMSTYTTPYTVSGSGSFDIDMRGTTVTGTVIDADTGEPIGDSLVSLTLADAQAGPRFFSPSTLTDRTGTFVLESVTPGSYRARAEKSGYAQQILDVIVSDRGTQDVQFRIARQEGLRVRIVDARDGRTLNGFIAAVDGANRPALERSTGPAADGSFRLPLGPGSYRLTINSPGYAPQELNVSVPSPSEVRVGLTPGGSLQIRSTSGTREVGRLVMPSGVPFRRGSGDPGSFIVPSGVSVQDNVTPGTYTLTIIDAQGQVRASRPVTIVEGRMTEVDV
jgi:protocatechuate 3,4-dioxygenase beta subunit